MQGVCWAVPVLHVLWEPAGGAVESGRRPSQPWAAENRASVLAGLALTLAFSFESV